MWYLIKSVNNSTGEDLHPSILSVFTVQNNEKEKLNNKINQTSNICPQKWGEVKMARENKAPRKNCWKRKTEQAQWYIMQANSSAPSSSFYLVNNWGRVHCPVNAYEKASVKALMGPGSSRRVVDRYMHTHGLSLTCALNSVCFLRLPPDICPITLNCRKETQMRTHYKEVRV